MEYVAIVALGLIDWYSHYGWFYLSARIQNLPVFLEIGRRAGRKNLE